MNTATKPKKAAPAIDLSGLGDFNVSSLMTAGAPEAKAASDGKPLELGVDDVVEITNVRDKDNPGFSPQSIAELAESINESNGVKTPISVGPKITEGEHAGKYPLHHGARRLRASRFGGRRTIKAFIDEDYDEYDQAIENIQREDLTPIEIARFIAKREAEPFKDSRAAIAKRLGKSKAYITQHASLLAMPELLRNIYDDNICRDVLALYELNNLHKKHAEAVEKYVDEAPEITRSSVEALKASLKAGAKAASDDGDEEGEEGEGGDGAGADPGKEPKTKPKKVSVMVKHEDTLYLLRLDLRPSALRLGWIEEPDTGKTMEVELSDLSIDSIVEG